MGKILRCARGALVSLLGDAGLFAFVSFVFAAFADIGLLTWYQEPLGLISRYVLTPWGVALVALRLARAQERRLGGADTALLAALDPGDYTVLRDYGDAFWDVRMNLNDRTNNFQEPFLLDEAPSYGAGRNG